ncbi:ParA family protein, partial [Halochromatium sp.]
MITVIGSLKGGSGKSTLTFNLGVWLSLAEVDVQLLDADPQGTLT